MHVPLNICFEIKLINMILISLKKNPTDIEQGPPNLSWTTFSRTFIIFLKSLTGAYQWKERSKFDFSKAQELTS